MPNDVPDIDCLTAVRQLWDYLDQELDDRQMAIVRQHLEQCRSCLPHHDFGRQFLQALHAARDAGLMPPETRRRVMERLTQAGLTIE